MSNDLPANWRDTYRHARLFILDARLLLLLLPMLMYIRTWTLLIVIAAAGTLYYFEKRRGIDIAGSLRLLRSVIVGSNRTIRMHSRMRSSIDYDRVDHASVLRSNDPS